MDFQADDDLVIAHGKPQDGTMLKVARYPIAPCTA
jgi:hypothetical protein